MLTVAVITFCVDRDRELERCINSVRLQQVPTIHYVFSERVNELKTSPVLKPIKDLVRWVAIEDVPYHEHSSPRMAKLRQSALEKIQEPFVCFLDDDNEFLPNHLSSLLHCIQEQQLDAAYSWRILLHPDGSLFEGDYYPWHADPKTASLLYKWCVDNEVIRLGDAVVYDGPRVSDDPRNVATVDMNEWLFRTKSLLRIGFNAEFTQEELDNQVGEDDKILNKILNIDFRFACSQQATVKYYLGGVSNSDDNYRYSI
ncbi:MAG: glycosyltransferase family 2 protein [Moorea sp. SIO3I7]|uniref:glycosyltransferase family A protein n=1 Tax=Moorena sp. SIO3I8 TaxID=2607833 RepID=UPI0013C12A57|nr:glycosyltransferase family A protein [Moorena sp. SIO3I8]NEN94791.1 glycosyltransferase family 2 protein [Moorena sp. SIO3I7]NEO05756.1 glycosyltransferase family 2 protein [Moorena sp. SIO3I8]